MKRNAQDLHVGPSFCGNVAEWILEYFTGIDLVLEMLSQYQMWRNQGLILDLITMIWEEELNKYFIKKEN